MTALSGDHSNYKGSQVKAMFSYGHEIHKGKKYGEQNCAVFVSFAVADNAHDHIQILIVFIIVTMATKINSVT